MKTIGAGRNPVKTIGTLMKTIGVYKTCKNLRVFKNSMKTLGVCKMIGAL